MPNFTYFNTLFLLVWLQVINKVKFIHQGEGDIKVKVKYLHSFKFYVAHTFCKRVVCIRLNAFLFFFQIEVVKLSFSRQGDIHAFTKFSVRGMKGERITQLSANLYVSIVYLFIYGTSCEM